MIKLNGLVIVNDDEIYFEDFTIETEEELDLPFDYLTDEEEDYYGYDCDDCEDCDCYDDENNYYDEDDNCFEEKYNDFHPKYQALLNKYADLLEENECGCRICAMEVFDKFYDEVDEM